MSQCPRAKYYMQFDVHSSLTYCICSYYPWNLNLFSWNIRLDFSFKLLTHWISQSPCSSDFPILFGDWTLTVYTVWQREWIDGMKSINNLRGKEHYWRLWLGSEQDYFLARFTELVAQYQRTSYSELIASSWLSLRLQVYPKTLCSESYILKLRNQYCFFVLYSY